MRRNSVSQFIQTIWDIVSDPVSDQIICWNLHGTSFTILDTQFFASNIIPKHFNHSNLSSFIRQLNMYNFHKKKSKSAGLEFHHKLFRRGAKELLMGIKRKPSEADVIEGQELLKCYLQKMDLNIEEKSTTSTDDRKDESHHLHVEGDGVKNLLEDLGEKKLVAKIIKNVILVVIVDNLN